MLYREWLYYGFMCSHCGWKYRQKWLSPKWHFLEALKYFSSFSLDHLSTLSSAVLGSRSVFAARDWDSVGLCSYDSHTLHWPDCQTHSFSLSSSFCLCWGGSSEGGTWGSICTCSACTQGQRVSHQICVTVLVCAFKVVAVGKAFPWTTRWALRLLI